MMMVMMMRTRKSPRARRNGRRLRVSGDIRPIGNAQVIVSHQKKSGDMMISKILKIWIVTVRAKMRQQATFLENAEAGRGPAGHSSTGIYKSSSRSEFDFAL